MLFCHSTEKKVNTWEVCGVVVCVKGQEFGESE